MINITSLFIACHIILLIYLEGKSKKSLLNHAFSNLTFYNVRSKYKRTRSHTLVVVPVYKILFTSVSQKVTEFSRC